MRLCLFDSRLKLLERKHIYTSIDSKDITHSVMNRLRLVNKDIFQR